MLRRIVRLVPITLVLACLFLGVLGCSTTPAAPPAVPTQSRVSAPLPVATATSVLTAPPTSISAPARVSGDGEIQVAREPRPVINPTSVALANTGLTPRTPPQPDDNVTAPRPPLAPFSDSELYIHLPPHANQNQPLRVVLALHGMGAQNDAFAGPLVAEADRNNWILVAPNFAYRDHLNLDLVMQDDLIFTKKLADTLDALPKRLNLTLRPRTLIFGFSRGAQLAHRFAMMYPERVSSVASMSAGTYTLPFSNLKNETTQ